MSASANFGFTKPQHSHTTRFDNGAADPISGTFAHKSRFLMIEVDETNVEARVPCRDQKCLNVMIVFDHRSGPTTLDSYGNPTVRSCGSGLQVARPLFGEMQICFPLTMSSDLHGISM